MTEIKYKAAGNCWLSEISPGNSSSKWLKDIWETLVYTVRSGLGYEVIENSVLSKWLQKNEAFHPESQFKRKKKK